jgi:hypothetical protein
MGMERQQSSMVRVAVWLAVDIQPGGVFTKQQLRDAVPNVEQADRRMRDLRAYGWRIDTSAEDASLRPNELRLVTVGDAVWDGQGRKQPPSKPTASQQRAALISAGYACESCGTGVGETFVEGGDVARLATRYVDPVSPTLIEVVCQRCRMPGTEAQESQEAALAVLADQLTPGERAELLDSLGSNAPRSAFERARSLLRRWPPSERERAAEILTSASAG